MTRRVAVVQVPRDSSIPSESISAPEWHAVQTDAATAVSTSLAAITQATLANTRVFDVREFGDIGTSDDSATFQAAIDAAGLAGGGVITGPAGQYKFLHGLRLHHMTSIAMPSRASTVFDFSDMLPANGAANAAGSRHCILGEGEFTSLPNLASAVNLSDTVTFASAHGLQSGDWFCLNNTVDSSFSPERAYYRDGEFCQVKSVSGNTVTLTRRTYSSYTTSTTATYKFAPMNTGISGVTAKLPLGVWGVAFDTCTGVEVNEIEFYGSDWGQIDIRKCVNVAMSNPRAWSTEPTDSAGVNYGLTISNSQHISIVNPFLESARHGFTTGGGSGNGNVPNRDIRVIGGTISTNGVGVAGCDLHANAEHCWFIGVSMPGGLHVAGDWIHVVDCDISSAPSGFAISAAHMLGYNLEITNCTIRATRPISTNGLVYIPFSPSTTRAGGHCRISGQIYVGGYRPASGGTYAIQVQNTSSVTGDVSIDVVGEARSVSIGETIWGVYVRATGSSSYHRTVNVKAQLQGMGIRVQNTVTTTVRDSTVINAPQEGIYVSGLNYVKSQGNHVRNTGSTGIRLAGPGKDTDSLVTSHGDESINNNQSQDSSSSVGANIYLTWAKYVNYRDAVTADLQGTPTATRNDAIIDVGTLFISPPTQIGGLANRREGIDNTVDV